MKKKILLLMSCVFLSGCAPLPESAMSGTDLQESVCENVSWEDTSRTESSGADLSGAGELTAHFLDVGQGDCSILVSDGHVMVIDCGDEGQGTKIQNYLQKQEIEEIEYLVLTHPDSDHIGGAPAVITKFEIGTVFVSGYEKDTRCYDRLTETLKYKRRKTRVPETGEKYTLGNAEITFYVPGETEDANNASLVVTVKNGNNVFLFTGDAESAEETDILRQGADVSADVYHVGHHGSSTSTSDSFLEAVHPEYAVISCGEGNDYGHPHTETTDKLIRSGTEIYRTDEQGTVTAVSDGENIMWSYETHTKDSRAGSYVCNTNTMKFHLPECESAEKISQSNREIMEDRNEIIQKGYQPCKLCNP